MVYSLTTRAIVPGFIGVFLLFILSAICLQVNATCESKIALSISIRNGDDVMR